MTSAVVCNRCCLTCRAGALTLWISGCLSTQHPIAIRKYSTIFAVLLQNLLLVGLTVGICSQGHY